MANKDAALDDFDDDAPEEDLTEGVKRKKLSGKKIVLFAGIGLAILGAAGGALMYLGIVPGGEDTHGGGEGTGSHGEAAASGGEAVFYDLPEILVTLNSSGSKTNYLKLQVSLELENGKGAKRLDEVLPRIIDNFQVYLRELRVEDLEGSGGLFRLKEELLVRVNAAARPVRVKDVLFQEMLVQ